MRKLVMICLCLFVSSDVWAASETINELFTITQIVEDENYVIEHWQIVMKEKLSDEQLINMQKKLQQKQSLTKDENNQRLKFTSITKNNLFTETYQLVIPKNRQHSPELMVVLEGDVWSDDHKKKLPQKITNLTTNYFTHLVNSYTCVSATNNDIINQMNFLKNLKKKLDLRLVETQLDTTQSTNKEIMYGFTPRWDNDIHIFDRRLNIQIVSWVKEGNKIIIGTPILISEY